MKTRWKILIFLGVLLVLAGVSAWVTAHHQPADAVEAYKSQLRARGEKLQMSEVLPLSVPVESNGAAMVREAFKLVVSSQDDYTNLPPMMKMVAPGKAIVGWMQPDLRETMSSAGYTNSWENVQAAVEDNRPAVEALVQAARFPVIDFQLDYRKGQEVLLPHLGLFRRGSLRLSAEAMWDLRAGDEPAVITNLCALLALEQANHEERVPLSQLVRIAMANIAAAASWELLQATNLTDGELVALQDGWERQEYIESMARAMEYQRVSNDAFVEKLRNSKAEYNGYVGGPGPSSGRASSGNWLEDAEELSQESFKQAKRGTADYLWRESWSYTDQLYALQGMQITLEAIRTIQTNQFFEPTMNMAITNLDKLHDTFSDSGWMAEFNGWLGGPERGLFAGGMSYTGSVMRKLLSAEATKRVVIVAIALKRFQLKRGNFPETLNELAPEFLPAVPLDPVDGKPLRCRRNADGTFLLYSIGDNGVDDGGDITPIKPAHADSTANWGWQRGRDWVWPQAATTAEIEDFYEHPPK